MSKYSDFLESQYQSVGKIKKATKTLIKNGKDLALKEWHDANSVERLKKCIREVK